MKFVKLTDADSGQMVLVNLDHVRSVRASHTTAGKCVTALDFEYSMMQVTESVEEIADKIFPRPLPAPTWLPYAMYGTLKVD